MPGEKEDSEPTEDLESPSKPASGDKPTPDRGLGNEPGGKAGVYQPIDDTIPPLEIPVDFSDTEEDIPVKEEVPSSPATSGTEGEATRSDSDDSCAEEGGVPRDILSLYGQSASDENEEEERRGEAETEETHPPHPDDGTEEPNTVNMEAPEELIRRVTRRFSAKLIDFLIAAVLYQVPGVAGPAAAVAYICLADGISGGSFGKRAAGGLRVVSTIKADEACDFRDSIFRNSIFGILVAAFFLLGWIPYFGKLVVIVVGLAVVVYEASLLYKVSNSTRIGDTLAGTRVIEPSPDTPEGEESSGKT